MITTRLRRTARTLAVGGLMFAIAAPQSYAWGREGHRLTALVAEQYLTPETKAAVAKLLHGQSLADIASWADEVRTSLPATAPWHYADIPKDADKFDRARDCPPNAVDPKSPWHDCVTDRINYFEGRLADTDLPEDERAKALKFIVHFIGDVHQPLHAIGDDRGGNGVPVAFFGNTQCGGYKCNLHGVWDVTLIEQRGLSEAKYKDLLLKEIKDNNWERMSGGEPTTWANVSHHYAVNAWAPHGALITHDYYNEEIKIVDAQLSLGGLRLARVLNRILGAPAEPSDPNMPQAKLPEKSDDESPEAKAAPVKSHD